MQKIIQGKEKTVDGHHNNIIIIINNIVNGYNHDINIGFKSTLQYNNNNNKIIINKWHY